MTLQDLLREAQAKRASDIHLMVGMPPAFRIDGTITMTTYAPVTVEWIRETLSTILGPAQWKTFEDTKEMCASYETPGLGRLRVTVYLHRGLPEISIRLASVWESGTQAASLGLPPMVTELARRKHGLILITGPTGVGKTTTLNYMIDLINRERSWKIITIEDPIEFTHRSAKSLIVQQEVGRDTLSFHRALIHALRQDPDAICIGEMRDTNTIETVLTAAETGHLVLATLHTPNAILTVDRIIGSFPEGQRSFIAQQFAGTLQGIIAQQLFPRASGKGRVLACEILIATDAVRTLMRERQTHQIAGTMQTGSRYGMVLMEQSLKQLYEAGTITAEVYQQAKSKHVNQDVAMATGATRISVA